MTIDVSAGERARRTSRVTAPSTRRRDSRENARLTFDQVANDRIQELIDSNFKFYKQITDDPEFARFFLGWLFDRYYRRASGPTGSPGTVR